MLCHEGDDADCMYFVIQGELIATYTLAAVDLHAQFFGKKSSTTNADGLIKALSTVKMVKDLSLRVADEARPKS